MTEQTKAKILHIDIETMFIQGAIWDLWNNYLSIDHILTDWYILCYAAKWDGSDEILYDALPRYKSYRKDPENDYNILLTLRDLLDEADIVVGHNGRKFDIKKINARFLKHDIPPPSPFRTVDTLDVAKKQFKLTSNKLEYLARYLGLGGKLDTDIILWKDIGAGDREAWERMITYNQHDVELLEQVYHKLLPWIDNHPNLALYSPTGRPSCGKCGSESIHFRGWAYTDVNRYRRFRCNDCGGWGRERSSDLTLEQKKGVMANARSNN